MDSHIYNRILENETISNKSSVPSRHHDSQAPLAISLTQFACFEAKHFNAVEVLQKSTTAFEIALYEEECKHDQTAWSTNV
jgi:hypothetical protein